MPKTKLQDTPTLWQLQVLEMLEVDIFLRPGRSHVRYWWKLVCHQIKVLFFWEYHQAYIKSNRMRNIHAKFRDNFTLIIVLKPRYCGFQPISSEHICNDHSGLHFLKILHVLCEKAWHDIWDKNVLLHVHLQYCNQNVHVDGEFSFCFHQCKSLTKLIFFYKTENFVSWRWASAIPATCFP